MNHLKHIDIEKVAAAIEADAGTALPDLRESLAEAMRGEFAITHTPEQIAARQRGRPVGNSNTKANSKALTSIRPAVSP